MGITTIDVARILDAVHVANTGDLSRRSRNAEAVLAAWADGHVYADSTVARAHRVLERELRLVYGVELRDVLAWEAPR